MTETSPTGRPGSVPSGSGTEAIQVKFLDNGNVLISSTKEPGDLMFTRDEWVAFAEGIKAGEFDYLT
jgi:hypothetical protein